MRVGIQLILLVMFLICSGFPALADAIDGQWCFERKNFSIDGSNFTTPSGKSITGEYDRHAYAYVVPDGEEGAGDRIEMTLIDDETIHLQRPSNNSSESILEVWKRCEVIS